MAEKRSRPHEKQGRSTIEDEPKKNGGNTTEDRVTRGRRKAEEDVGILDNPDIFNEPSELRHIAYFAGVVALGLVLNLVAMLVVAGGQ